MFITPAPGERATVPLVALCKCGCGEHAPSGRVFINKEHQLDWMNAGGASELNALLPTEVRQAGGSTAGKLSHESGRLAQAAKKGGQRSREIAAEWRDRRSK